MINFIAKPQKGRGKRLLEQIEARMIAEKIEYRLFITEQKGDAGAIAERLTRTGERKLVVVGGDGMLNEVLSGIVDPSVCSLGLIPAGTGNDFAASAGIPKGIAALNLILDGTTRPVDYIAFADGRRSINIAGIGIDVDILTRCERMKFFRAKSKYFFSLIASLFTYRGCRLRVSADGGKSENCNAMIAAICNGSRLGGGIPLCPGAEIADGKLELVVVDCPKRSKLFGALVKLMQGKVFTLPFARRISCERAKIEPGFPGFAQYDGELFRARSLDATVVHGKLFLYRS